MSYTAIIVEPRQHRALAFVLHNFLTNLSDDWNIVVCHGSENIAYTKNIITSLETTRITTVNLNVRNLTRDGYSRLLTTKEFYKYIPTEIFMIFQTDTMLFSKQNHQISEFLEYDYVGAPWPNTPSEWKGTKKPRKDLRVGNGGLSLRRKSKMLEIIRSEPYRGGPEDVYFCNSEIVMNTPSVDQAMRFSVEHMFYPTSFGCHQPWVSKEYESLKLLYPSLSILQELNTPLPSLPARPHPRQIMKTLQRKNL